MVLSNAERERTARHLVLAGFGTAAQERLRGGHAAVVGAGGLGSPVILALASSGVGTITVIDDDVVEASNLQRQVIHRAADIGRAKLESAVRVGADLSPETTIVPVAERLTADNALELLRGADVVIDGSDDFATREAVAAACEVLEVPLVWGAVEAFDGQVTVFWSAPPEGAPIVLSDLYPPGSEAPSCAEVGVFGPLCLQVGALMAAEAVKLLTGAGEPLLGRVLAIDARRAKQWEVPLGPARASVVAATTPQITPGDLLAALDGDDPPTILDVRDRTDATPEAWGPDALRIPLDEVLLDPPEIAGTVVVVCEYGIRSRRAVIALRAAGVDAVALIGGTRTLRSAVVSE